MSLQDDLDNLSDTSLGYENMEESNRSLAFFDEIIRQEDNESLSSKEKCNAVEPRYSLGL